MTSLDMPDRLTGDLFSDALSAPDADTRWTFVVALHLRATREVFETARDLCASDDAVRRVLGVDVLSQLGTTFAGERLALVLARLDDDDVRVVASAACALGHFDDAPTKVAPLVALSAHPSPEVRRGVAFGLGACSDPAAVGAMITLSADADDDVRDWAIFGLGETNVDTPEVRAALWARVDDANRDVREEGIAALAIRHDARVVPHVAALLGSDEVGGLAVEAARDLGDPSLRAPLVAVRAWWPRDEHDRRLLAAAIRRCARARAR